MGIQMWELLKWLLNGQKRGSMAYIAHKKSGWQTERQLSNHHCWYLLLHFKSCCEELFEQIWDQTQIAIPNPAARVWPRGRLSVFIDMQEHANWRRWLSTAAATRANTCKLVPESHRGVGKTFWESDPWLQLFILLLDLHSSWDGNHTTGNDEHSPYCMTTWFIWKWVHLFPIFYNKADSTLLNSLLKEKGCGTEQTWPTAVGEIGNFSRNLTEGTQRLVSCVWSATLTGGAV